MNADGRAVRWKLNAIKNIFAPIVRAEGDAGRADDVIANLPERGGRALAIVAVNLVVIRIISVAVLRQDVAGGARRRQNTRVLLQHDRVVYPCEKEASVSGRLRIQIVVLEQSIRAVEISHRSIAVNTVGSPAASERDVVVLDVGVPDAAHVDHFRIRAGG